MSRPRLFLAGILAVLGAAPAWGRAQVRPVLLQIHPRAGDTLTLRLDESIEMVGTVRNGDSQSSTRESSSLVLFSRLVVESADDAGSTVLATADSVALSARPNSTSGALLAWATVVQGKRFRLRVALDGSTTIESSGRWAPAAAGVLSQLPATMPHDPISPGTSWSSAMDVPLAGAADPQARARLTATFRFDSLSSSGRLAWLTVSGRLVRPGAGPKGGGVEVLETAGTVSGRVVVDRARGWITDAHTTIKVRSLVVASGRNRPPMRVDLTITQRVRAR